MKWISLFLIALAVHSKAQSVNIGVTDLLPNLDYGNAGLILAQQVNLSQPAALQSISFYVVQNSGTMRLGLYDANGASGNPGNKLAETPVITPTVGWNTVPAPYERPSFWRRRSGMRADEESPRMKLITSNAG